MLLNTKKRFNPGMTPQEKGESALNESTRKYFSSLIENQNLTQHKAPQANQKLKYKKTLEISVALTLAALLTTIQLTRQHSWNVTGVDEVAVTIEVADIPVTMQQKLPPPPVRPSVPVPSEEESIPDDLTIASTDLDLTEIPPPPGMPEEDLEIFVAYDEPPTIIGGMAELVKHLQYPRLAHAANIEGTVFVKVLVSPKGETEKTAVLSSKPEKMGFEESAMEALKKVKWHPAKQRDRNIRVWVSIPVQFKLISS